MIVQCEACQTRFRLADEKIKAGGTKVRCSKCKEVFTVMPPETEAVEETVEFDSFNMERVTDDAPGTAAPDSDSPETESPEPEEPSAEHSAFATSGQSQNSELDFSSLEAEMADNTGLGEELADDFSFADTSQPVDEEVSSSEPDVSFNEQAQEKSTGEEQDDFGAAFAETEEAGGLVEFDFSDDSEAAETAASESPTEDAGEPGEFSFGDEGGADAFSFEEPEQASVAAASEDYSEPGEFSFDDEPPFGEDSTTEWNDTASENTSFDFDEPQFDSDEAPAAGATTGAEDDGLQFGEIDFANDSDQSAAPSSPAIDDFSKATIAKQEEPEPFSQKQQSAPPPPRDYDKEEQFPAPPRPKKSSLSRILFLLILMLVVLGGAAGYLFMQEGSLNLNTAVKYLPFLKDYIGEAPPVSPGDRIGINIIGSSYVKGKVGQMLVIQGSAVNNHPKTRSAITIKGILLDAQGKALLQQTVFCGNKLDDAALRSMPFSAIEEAMNNQFGDSLSNMNVAAGAAIPFTIVFRNLPAGIAKINVEVVDSKPGTR